MNEESSLQPQTTNQNSQIESVQNTQQSIEETKQAEIDSKIEAYKVTDKNLKEDRWSLDSKLYYKK